jgi:hypothetical protein
MRPKKKHSCQAHIGLWVPQLQLQDSSTARRPVVEVAVGRDPDLLPFGAVTEVPV